MSCDRSRLGRAAVQRARVPQLSGALMPGIIDRHVHLGLVDAAALADTAVVEVHDLGWVPRIARGWKIDPPTGGLVRIAGPFLTAIGGYPVDRAWAPSGSVRELTGPADGIRAVEEAAAHGHDLIKLVLHSGGPLLDDATLVAVVRAAHRASAACWRACRGSWSGPPGLRGRCRHPRPCAVDRVTA